jgi:YidC/Oxa1 family membrane protein insertase
MFGFLAQLLNFCYTIWANYAGMIVIFTLILMVVITPFTVKGMRSAAEMSRLQPEIKKIQDQNKNDRIKQNEEMQALFKEHGVNPLGGCLPTLLPLPIFFIVFRLLEHLNGRKTGAAAPMVRLLRGQVGGPGGYVAPHYLAYPDKLTQAIIHDNGVLKAFGMNLAAKARDHHGSVAAALPFYILIAIMTASQYWQQRQINQRNPAAANANPQMKMTMQLFPAFYAIISLNIPATVVFYLLVSGLFRMAQNSLSYRYDPVLKTAMQSLPGGTIDAKSEPKAPPPLPPAKGGGRPPAKQAAPAAPPPKPGGFMERLRAQAADAKAQAERQQQERAAKGQGGSGRTSGTSGRTSTGNRASGNGRPQGGGAKSGGNGKNAGRGARPPGKAAGGAAAAGAKAVAPGKPPEVDATPEPVEDAMVAPAEATSTPTPAPSPVEDQIEATEAGADAATDGAPTEEAPVSGPAPTGGGNGSSGGKGASPLRVTRPSGRPAPPRGRKPRPGQ